MKIGYDHILNFLLDKPSIQDLSSKLFQLGHEHEIEDLVFDFEFTPNRGDCLSVLGIARDLNVFYKTNLDIPVYNKDLPSLELNFINNEEQACPHISFLNIEIKDNICEYKDYLKNYFEDFKLNRNNFFTDISNYVAYEMGQPTHCYDFPVIGDDITLRIKKNEAKFTSLLNNKIDLNGQDLVFTSNENIINLSGIMGGLESSCTKDTTNALVECAYFKPESIIGKALKYNLHSDASHKFERGTDPKSHERALRRFIQIVSEHSKIIKLGLYTYKGPEYKEAELNFDLEKIKNILGININEDVYRESLIKLGFNISKKIKVPSYRSDVIHQNDLAEEIARVIGYDNIPASSIKLVEMPNKTNLSNERKIKAFLIDQNFVEVINSPFCATKGIDSIKVDNPLDSNRKYIRCNLIDSLTDNLIYNEKRQQDSIKFFEISDVYKSTKNLKVEKRLALIISGRMGHDHINFSKKLDKKYLIELFKKINMNIEEYFVDINRKNLDSKIKTPVFAIELPIDEILEKIQDYPALNKPLSEFIKYIPISDYPLSYRDLSFSVKNSLMINKLIKTLSKFNSENIKSSFMFDFYVNKQINETKIGYRFIFQSDIKTLEDYEINKEIKNITDSALSIESVSLPGS